MISKDRWMFSCTRSFTKCDDLYSDISIEFRSITITFVWGEYIIYLSECDDFVFRKVNWPLPLRWGRWVGFRLTTKLPKPNCWRSLIVTDQFWLICCHVTDWFWLVSFNDNCSFFIITAFFIINSIVIVIIKRIKFFIFLKVFCSGHKIQLAMELQVHQME